MAKVADVFLNGTIGNVVFYRRMNIYCARSAAFAWEAIGSNENKIGKFWYCYKGRQRLTQRATATYVQCNRQKHSKPVFRRHSQIARRIGGLTLKLRLLASLYFDSGRRVSIWLFVLNFNNQK